MKRKKGTVFCVLQRQQQQQQHKNDVTNNGNFFFPLFFITIYVFPHKEREVFFPFFGVLASILPFFCLPAICMLMYAMPLLESAKYVISNLI